MEIDVTRIFREGNPERYSASRMELGDDAGRITWSAAKRRAKEPPPLLPTEEAKEAARSHFRGYGAWSEEEIAAWSDDELDAVVIQEVAADMREGGLDGIGRQNWKAYRKDAEAGRIRGALYPAAGRVWIYLE